jgi:hypothetical protein
MLAAPASPSSTPAREKQSPHRRGAKRAEENHLTAETQRPQRKDKSIPFRKAGKTGRQEKNESFFFFSPFGFLCVLCVSAVNSL